MPPPSKEQDPVGYAKYLNKQKRRRAKHRSLLLQKKFDKILPQKVKQMAKKLEDMKEELREAKADAKKALLSTRRPTSRPDPIRATHHPIATSCAPQAPSEKGMHKLMQCLT